MNIYSAHKIVNVSHRANTSKPIPCPLVWRTRIRLRIQTQLISCRLLSVCALPFSCLLFSPSVSTVPITVPLDISYLGGCLFLVDRRQSNLFKPVQCLLLCAMSTAGVGGHGPPNRTGQLNILAGKVFGKLTIRANGIYSLHTCCC